MKGNRKSKPCKKFLNLPKCVVEICQLINILSIDKGETLGDGVGKLVLSTEFSPSEMSDYRFHVMDVDGGKIFTCHWTYSRGSISSIDERKLQQYELNFDWIMDELITHFESSLDVQCLTPKDISMLSTACLISRFFLIVLGDGKLRGLERVDDQHVRWYLRLETVRLGIKSISWTWPSGNVDTFYFGEVPDNVTKWDDSDFYLELESLKARRKRRKKAMTKEFKRNPSKVPFREVSNVLSFDTPDFELEF